MCHACTVGELVNFSDSPLLGARWLPALWSFRKVFLVIFFFYSYFPRLLFPLSRLTHSLFAEGEISFTLLTNDLTGLLWICLNAASVFTGTHSCLKVNISQMILVGIFMRLQVKQHPCKFLLYLSHVAHPLPWSNVADESMLGQIVGFIWIFPQDRQEKGQCDIVAACLLTFKEKWMTQELEGVPRNEWKRKNIVQASCERQLGNIGGSLGDVLVLDYRSCVCVILGKKNIQ